MNILLVKWIWQYPPSLFYNLLIYFKDSNITIFSNINTKIKFPKCVFLHNWIITNSCIHLPCIPTTVYLKCIPYLQYHRLENYIAQKSFVLWLESNRWSKVPILDQRSDGLNLLATRTLMKSPSKISRVCRLIIPCLNYMFLTHLYLTRT